MNVGAGTRNHNLTDTTGGTTYCNISPHLLELGTTNGQASGKGTAVPGSIAFMSLTLIPLILPRAALDLSLKLGDVIGGRKSLNIYLSSHEEVYKNHFLTTKN